MKRQSPLLTAALCIAALSMTACDRDILPGADLEMSGFVTCSTNDNGHIIMIEDDMGQKFTVNDSRYVLGRNTKSRRICTYVIGQDSSAAIRSLYIPKCNAATDIGSIEQERHIFDPVGIESAYIGGGYLNVVMTIMTHDETSYMRHYLETVRLDSTDSLVFSFIHNANGDVPVYSKKMYFCIPLSAYCLQKNDAVFLKYRNYREEDCCLKYVYR